VWAASRVRYHPTLRFAVGALIAFTIVAATYWLLVATEPGQRLENLALTGAELRSPTDREAGLERLRQISVAVFALAIAATFTIGLLRRRGGLGSLVAAVMIGSVVVAEALKEILPRPELVTGPAWLLRNSFPSGSAAVATAIAVGAFLVVPDRIRWLILPIGAVYAGVIGEAIQTTGWHRLSDTIGSVALVIGVAFAGLAVLSRVGLVHRSEYGRVDRRIQNVLSVIAMATLVLGAALIALLALFPLLTAPEGSRRAFLQTAFPLFGAGFTILALVLFARLTEPYALGRGRRADDAPPPPTPDGTLPGPPKAEPG
jgi:hypothetical protein